MSRSGQRLQDEGTRLQVVTAGAAAGLLSRFVTAPLDVVKIRLQLQTHSLSSSSSSSSSSAPRSQPPPLYKGTLPTLRRILRDEGVTGLWKGNVPAELLYVSYGAVQFTAYRSTTMALHSLLGADTLPKPAESFIAGAGAGATATAATYPLDLLRTRLAAQGAHRVYPSLRAAVRDIARDEGWRGFFRGLGPALSQIVPFMGLFFTLYEGLRGPLAALDLLPLGGGDAAAGVVAGVAAKTGVFPLDLVRKRIQVQGPTRGRYAGGDAMPAYELGTWRTVGAIARAEGVRGLYRGLTVSLIKAAPAYAVTMWTYESVLRFLIDASGKREGQDAQ